MPDAALTKVTDDGTSSVPDSTARIGGFHLGATRTLISRTDKEGDNDDAYSIRGNGHDGARGYQSGRLDAYGQSPERRTADGRFAGSLPALSGRRRAGRGSSVFAYRPFTTLHAYSETGPISSCL